MGLILAKITRPINIQLLMRIVLLSYIYNFDGRNERLSEYDSLDTETAEK